MDINNLIKIIAAAITVVISFTVGFRVLRLNPDNLLNKWFTLFFISSSLGFLIYTIYHLILNYSQIIIPMMITAQIFFNLIFISLMMTVFVLEKYEKVAMSPRYLGIMIVIFIIMSTGYLIWRPTLNMERYTLDIVDTKTPLPWFISIISIRAVLLIYVVYKYALMSRNLEGETKKRVQWFFIGIIFIFIALLVDLVGGAFDFILIEVFALISVDIATITIFKGFLIK
ncbi:MAG: hypothetical protein ACFE92_08080 [Promethearchaeota archaeon]